MRNEFERVKRNPPGWSSTEHDTWRVASKGLFIGGKARLAQSLGIVIAWRRGGDRRGFRQALGVLGMRYT